ncbi:MAG: tRNA pseudouridine(38-40) synthase TruA [Ignavibacteriaceae bacterium]
MIAAVNNYKLLIEYDGTNYSGWQIQPNALTVQQVISDAIKILTKEDVNLIGSGRTDSGVHSLGQTANFKAQKEINIFKFIYSLNSLLPKDISVKKMENADINFNARINAKRRIYIYLFTRYKSPFFDRYSYFYHDKIDCNKLNILSCFLTGPKNFTSFCKTISDTENKICNVYNIRWKESKGMVFFFIEADRYLHGMVRTIIGTLLYTAKKGLNENYIEEVFSAKNRTAAGEAVPAKGLFLYKVRY